MNPDNNQTTPAPAQLPESPQQPNVPPKAAVTVGAPPKSHKKILILITFMIILVLVGGGIGLYVAGHHPKTTSAPKTTVTKKLSGKTAPITMPAVVDTWTGKGASTNWSDTANWDNGVPKANYALVFNLAPNSASGQMKSNNDLTGVLLNSLTFSGGTPNAHGVETISLTGNPLSLSNGINDKTEADVNTSVAIGINLTSDQTFSLNGSLGFVPVSSSGMASTNLNLSSHTLTVMGSYGISFNYLSGSGTLVIDPAIGTVTVATISQPSPDFTGSVKVKSGIFGITYGGSLGTASIQVSDGATLRYVINSPTNPITNNISLAGKGAVDSSGSYFGAIDLVGSSHDVTFSGKVTLMANTQLGVYGSKPGDGSGTYTFTQAPTLNGYSLTGLNSNTKIVTK